MLALLWVVAASCQSDRIRYTNTDAERLRIVREYATRVLIHGSDRWSGEQTPLLANGVHVDTGNPAMWRHNGQEYIISNLANQQNLFRLFMGLSRITSESRFEEAALASVRYHFDHLASSCGLLRWGGHQFIDLRTLKPVGHFDANAHEFKNNFPFYELLWSANHEATLRFLRAMWNAHVLDWSMLDMNRHGQWGLPMSRLWDHSFSYPAPFFEGDGLTFINAGSDLIYAAGIYYHYAGDSRALTWSKRLHGMYVSARHPDTGLGAYQYSKPVRRMEPVIPMTTERHTWSTYGDRAENQFGAEFGDVAREGWVLWGNRIKTIYVSNSLMNMHLVELLGHRGREFLRDTISGLRALALYGYDAETNSFRPMWADGTVLTGKTVNNRGYYCMRDCDPEQVWVPLEADHDFLLTYLRAYRLSGNRALWKTARDIAIGLGMGDIGRSSGASASLSPATGSDYREIYSLIELYRISPRLEYIQRARSVADRLLEEHYHNGYFLPSADHIYANFDNPKPLALLALDALLRGEPDLVPNYIGGRGYIHGNYDGYGRTYDHIALWERTR